MPRSGARRLRTAGRPLSRVLFSTVARGAATTRPAFSRSRLSPLPRSRKPRSVTSGASMCTTSPWPAPSITTSPSASSVSGLSMMSGAG